MCGVCVCVVVVVVVLCVCVPYYIEVVLLCCVLSCILLTFSSDLCDLDI